MKLSAKHHERFREALDQAIADAEKEWTAQDARVEDLEFTSAALEIKLDLYFRHPKVKRISVNPLVVVNR